MENRRYEMEIAQNIDADIVVLESKVIILFSDAERLYCRFRYWLGMERYGDATTR